MAEWYKSWFDTEYYNLLYQHRDNSEARIFIETLVKQIPHMESSKVLDLACGEGRHSNVLHDLGFEVTGIDISPNRIKAATSLTSDKLDFFIHDMQDVFRINYFDIVVNLFTSFGYFDCPKMEKKIAQSIFANLKKGGYFLIDYLNTSLVSKGLDVHEEKMIGNVQFKINKFISGDWIIKEIIVCEGQKCRIFEEHVKLYSHSDMSSLFESVGFHLVNTFGNYNLNEYQENESTRMILLFRK